MVTVLTEDMNDEDSNTFALNYDIFCKSQNDFEIASETLLSDDEYFSEEKLSQIVKNFCKSQKILKNLLKKNE